MFRRTSIAALDFNKGDTVLERGCGPRSSFERLRSAVGVNGMVVGVDYSSGMVQQANEKIDDAGWDNVHVIQADATESGLTPEFFDAVYAAMSLSAMPDPIATVENVARYLTAEGRMTVLDAQPFQQMPLFSLNPIAIPVFKRLTNWRSKVDIPDTIGSTSNHSIVHTYHFGSIYIATGSQPERLNQ